jgi:hypothetical protein
VAKTKPMKPATSSGSSRRDKLASIEASRKSEQRRRTIGLLAICLVLAGGLLAYPVYLFVQDARARGAVLADIGVPVAQAGCAAPVENAASGNQEHVQAGTPVNYPAKPPASGPHYDTPAPFTKRFYTASDRPAVETLVHNLEHGYTVAWYRDTMPADQITALDNVSKTFSASEYDPNQKFIAAPWSEADGGPFPEGQNVILARWTADPNNPGDTASQRGVEQSCTAVSGQAISEFMAKYPSTNAPEPNGA